MASPILAGLTILILGDSHFATSGYLATTLGDALVQGGATVTTEAACGAPASIWVAGGVAPCGSAERVGSGPLRRSTTARVASLDQLVATAHPNLLIIGAGDTMAGYPQATFPADWTGEQVTALTRRIQATNIPCLWIGPGWGTEGGPYFKTYDRVRQVNGFLAAHVAPCRYIDSTASAAPGEWPTFDGQHYTIAGYQKWGRALYDSVVTLTRAR